MHTKCRVFALAGCTLLLTGGLLAGCGSKNDGGEAATPEKVQTEGKRNAAAQQEMYKSRMNQGAGAASGQGK